MKRNLKVWLILASILALMIFTLIPVFAEEPITEEPVTEETVVPAPSVTPIPKDGLTDHLETAEDVKWYSFELSNEGAVLISVQSLQERWTGYTYYWYATLYAADMETVIAGESIRGADYLTTLSAGDLAPGTYYLKINSVAFNNPLMAGFTNESYQLSLKTFDYAAKPTYEKDRVLVLTSADQFICRLGDTYFYKLNDGEAYAALFYNKKGVIVPVLISEQKEAVEFFASDGTLVPAYEFPHEYEGKKYYYSNSDCLTCQTGNERPFFFLFSQNRVNGAIVNEIMEQYTDDIGGGFSLLKFIQDNWVWISIVGGILLIILILAAKDKLGEYTSSSNKGSSGRSSDGSTYTGSDSSDTEQRLQDLDDMEIAQTITKNLNTPGYDTESFGPDVETFPTDIDSFPPSTDM